MSTKHNEKPTPLHKHIKDFIEKYAVDSKKLSGLSRAVRLFYHEGRSEEESKEMYNIFAKYAVDTIDEYWEDDNFYKDKYWEVYYFLSVCFLRGRGYGTAVNKEKARLHLKLAIYMIFVPPYKLLCFKKGKVVESEAIETYKNIDSIMDEILAPMFLDIDVAVIEEISNLKKSVKRLRRRMKLQEDLMDLVKINDEDKNEKLDI